MTKIDPPLHPAMEKYLVALETSLRKTPTVVPEEGLADAREFLLSEWESLAGRSSSSSADELFRYFVAKFGSPEEVAAAYATASEASHDDVARPVVAGSAPSAAIGRRKVIAGVALAVLLVSFAGWRLLFGAVDGQSLVPFEAGPAWARRVVSFRPGSPPPLRSVDPRAALGRPDFSGDNSESHSYVALGRGGQLVLEFFEAELCDGPGPDLEIVEIGALAEAVAVSVSTDGDRWVNVGEAKGAESTIDLHGRAPTGDRFRFVRLVDLGSPGAKDNQWPGADIDAVVAIHAVKSP